MKRALLFIALLAILLYCGYAYLHWSGDGEAARPGATSVARFIEAALTAVGVVIVLAWLTRKKR